MVWLLGISFSINEMIFRTDVRPEALAFCVLLLGLPAMLNVRDLVKRIALVTEEAKETKEEG